MSVWKEHFDVFYVSACAFVDLHLFFKLILILNTDLIYVAKGIDSRTIYWSCMCVVFFLCAEKTWLITSSIMLWVVKNEDGTRSILLGKIVLSKEPYRRRLVVCHAMDWHHISLTQLWPVKSNTTSIHPLPTD